MRIQISYQTQELPPPYAFAASFDLALHERNVAVSFQMEYLGREELSSEEVTAAGFTEDDNFSWDGVLGMNWVPVLEGLDLLPYSDEPSVSAYLHIIIDDVQKGFLPEDHEVIIQELIQAIFESAKKELPLKIQVLDQEKAAQTLLWSFKERKFHIDDSEFDWEQSKPLMNFMYSIEYDTQASSDSPQPDSVHYQDTGEWLKITSDKTIQKIARAIEGVKKT